MGQAFHLQSELRLKCKYARKDDTQDLRPHPFRGVLWWAEKGGAFLGTQTKEEGPVPIHRLTPQPPPCQRATGRLTVLSQPWNSYMAEDSA